jgi:integrase
MFKLRLITAQRGGEFSTMEWADIDFDSAMWTIPAHKAKNGLAHRVPLTPFALNVLAPLIARRLDPEWASRWVFPNWGPYKARKDRQRPVDEHVSNIQKATQRIRSREGCGVAFTGHDLRRTAASHMASMGVPRLVISKILNHAESGVTHIYDRHSYDIEKRGALEQWSVRLEEILKGAERPGLTTVHPAMGEPSRVAKERSFND